MNTPDEREKDMSGTLNVLVMRATRSDGKIVPRVAAQDFPRAGRRQPVAKGEG